MSPDKHNTFEGLSHSLPCQERSEGQAEVLEEREDDIAWLLIKKWKEIVFDGKPKVWLE